MTSYVVVGCDRRGCHVETIRQDSAPWCCPLHAEPAASHPRTLRLRACCSLEVVVSPVETAVQHEHGCPSIDSDHPRFEQHRIKADRAVARAIELLS